MEKKSIGFGEDFYILALVDFKLEMELRNRLDTININYSIAPQGNDDVEFRVHANLLVATKLYGIIDEIVRGGK